jgi:tetratricopeptide (TPR) repeat protein
MSETVPPPLGLALGYLRVARGWTQKRLAAAAGTRGQVICEYEAGTRRRQLNRETFDRLTALLGYGPDEVDLTILFVAGLTSRTGDDCLTPIDPPPGEQRRIDRIAAYVGLLEAGRMRAELRRLAGGRRAAAARSAAGGLWEELRRHTPAWQRRLVETRPELHTWALAERLCEESERVAAERPARALDLARLALRVAELAPGDARWRSCLHGWVQGFIANALRVADDRQASEVAFATAWRLWQAGGPAAQGPLGEWRLLDLEASLRRDLRQFPAAVERLRRALATAPAWARGRILLKQGFTFEQAGQVEPALAALEEAAPLLDAAGNRRLRMGVRFNRLVNLCHLGRFAEAQASLPELRRLIPARSADAVRLLWLSGRVVAGLGRRTEALRAFKGAQRKFTLRRHAYDAALVSLELSILHLEDGHSAKVAALAEEMVWIFASQRVHREALAALRLFVEAAQTRTATVALARHVLAFLERSRHDLLLRFEEPG